jgi:hypothetical protein
MYVIVCKDDGKWYVATRQVFPEYEEALKAARYIHKSREPRVVSAALVVLALPAVQALPGLDKALEQNPALALVPQPLEHEELKSAFGMFGRWAREDKK